MRARGLAVLACFTVFFAVRGAMAQVVSERDRSRRSRQMMRRYDLLLLVAAVAGPSWATVVQAQENGVPLRWLGDRPPALETGVSWGVPWRRGEVGDDAAFRLVTADGQTLPLQSWPMAFWPDGSVKWTGHATIGGPETAAELRLISGREPGTADSIRIRESETTYEVDTGPLQLRITKWGGDLFRSITLGGREVARNGRLIALVQQGPDGDHQEVRPREEYISKVDRVTLESPGPVRAVLKVEGVHKGVSSSREWLPFVVRLYLYAGQEAVRMVHSFIYDGDAEQDVIRGLGLRISVPMNEQIQNRHIRFTGDGDGLWSEPIQPMVGRGGRFSADPETGEDVYPQQLGGNRVPDRQAYDERGRNLLDDWAVWNDFRLIQSNADGFSIQKRTGSGSAWIAAGAGRRASGLVFAGDVSGGLGVSLNDFWQSHPSGLEVRNAASGEADLYVWLWTPDAPEMDMRHYDTRPHGLEAAYEDVQQGFSDAYGVARTSEIMLFATPSVPGAEEIVRMAEAGSGSPLISATPGYLHSTGVFGYWSLPDRSTPFKTAIEERLDSYIAYYQNAVEQHRWYGFWDYGDVMHSYDYNRHVWRYDLGGMAWANTELMPDMWLWYSFLRTGRADIFRMAEAMTRHTQEVDVYHAGRFAGLGSRHNVRHWGDGAKEVRISQSALKRFYYYLTADERTGDLMREATVNALEAIARLDPMRLAQPPTEEEENYPARLRIGPDWLALVGNWMTEWERTGDEKWRDLIFTGIESIAGFPYGLRTGRNLVVGMDPETGRLFQLSDEPGTYNLATIMGGGEVGIELSRITDHADWHRLWLQYARLYDAPRDVLERDMESRSEGEDGSFTRPDRLAAYAYMKTGNPAFAREALTRIVGRSGAGPLPLNRIEGPLVLNPVDEAPRVSTNEVAQWSLNAIEILEMCADQLPYDVPEADIPE